MQIKLPKSLFKKGTKIRIAPKPIYEPSDVPRTPETVVLDVIKKKTIPALIESLGDADPYLRSVSAEVLGRLKEKKAVQSLAALLSDHSKYVREKAAISLGHIGDKSSVPALIKALNDESEEVRVTVAGVLGHLRDRLAVPALIVSLADPSAHTRMKAGSRWVLSETLPLSNLYSDCLRMRTNSSENMPVKPWELSDIRRSLLCYWR